MAILILYVAVCLLVAFVGMGKRGSFLLLFVICLVLTPVVGIVVALMTRDGKTIRDGRNDFAMISSSGEPDPSHKSFLGRIFRPKTLRREAEIEVVASVPEAINLTEKDGNL
jgi:hypothetical protein